MRGSAPVVALLSLLLQVWTSHALGGYPGTFYQIMLRFNKERKYARTAPSPSRLWAILDPAASLGSLSREPLNSNRIVRSAAFRSPEPRQLEASRDPVVESSPEDPVTEEVTATLQTRAPLEEAVTQTPPVEALQEADLTQTPPVEAPQEEAVTQTPLVEAPLEETVTQTQTPPEESVTPSAEVSQTVVPAAGAEDGHIAESVDSAEPRTEACGGDVWLQEADTNLTVQEGGKLEQTLATPGWDTGEYPQGIECVWNINVGTECRAGLLLYKVLEGEVRETSRCSEDFLEVIQPNGFSTKYCGPLVNRGRAVSGTDTWSSAQPRTTTLRFKSTARRPDLATSSSPRGFKMEVTYYCWVYNQAIRGTSVGAAAGSGTSVGDAAGSGTSVGAAAGSGTSLGDAAGSGTSVGDAAGSGTSVGDAAGSGTSVGAAAGSGTSVGDTAGSGTSVGAAAGSGTSVGAAAGSGTSVGAAAGSGTSVGDAAGSGTSGGDTAGSGTSVGDAAGSGTSKGTGTSGESSTLGEDSGTTTEVDTNKTLTVRRKRQHY
nr:mucin-19-like [Procambarus clarkii]